MELGDVAQHQHDAVPGSHAEPLEVRRRAGDVLGVLRVGPLGEGAVGLLGAETDLFGVGRHRVEEAADDRLALGRFVEAPG